MRWKDSVLLTMKVDQNGIAQRYSMAELERQTAEACEALRFKLENKVVSERIVTERETTDLGDTSIRRIQ